MSNTPNKQELLFQLMTSEERYRNFMNASLDAIFVSNLSGSILDVNNSACDSLGYTRQELLSSYVWDIEIAITEETIMKHTEELKQGPLNLEGVHRRKDGSTFPVDVRLNQFSTMGEPFVLAIVRNITEHKSCQETVKRLTHALDQSSALMVVMDKNGLIDYVNKRVIEKTGFSYQEIVGQHYLVFQPQKSSAEINQSITTQLNQKQEWHGTVFIKTKQDHALKFLARVFLLRDENNEKTTHYLALIEEVPLN